MQKSKKVLTVLLSVLMALSAAACSSPNESSKAGAEKESDSDLVELTVMKCQEVHSINASTGEEEVIRYLDYVFDEFGNEIKIIYRTDAKEESYKLFEYEYDSDANCMSVFLLKNDGSRSGIVNKYTYNTDGNLTDYVNGSTKGVNASHFTFEYDEEGRVCQRTQWLDSGEEAGWTAEYLYDKNGYLSKQEIFNGKTCKGWVDFTCDENGNPISSKRYNAEGEQEDSWSVFVYETIQVKPSDIPVKPTGFDMILLSNVN